jgi:hypothetical protein
MFSWNGDSIKLQHVCMNETGGWVVVGIINTTAIVLMHVIEIM